MRTYLYGHETSWLQISRSYKGLSEAWDNAHNNAVAFLYIYEDGELIAAINLLELMPEAFAAPIMKVKHWKKMMIDRARQQIRKLKDEKVQVWEQNELA